MVWPLLGFGIDEFGVVFHLLSSIIYMMIICKCKYIPILKLFKSLNAFPFLSAPPNWYTVEFFFINITIIQYTLTIEDPPLGLKAEDSILKLVTYQLILLIKLHFTFIFVVDI